MTLNVPDHPQILHEHSTGPVSSNSTEQKRRLNKEARQSRHALNQPCANYAPCTAAPFLPVFLLYASCPLNLAVNLSEDFPCVHDETDGNPKQTPSASGFKASWSMQKTPRNLPAHVPCLPPSLFVLSLSLPLSLSLSLSLSLFAYMSYFLACQVCLYNLLVCCCVVQVRFQNQFRIIKFNSSLAKDACKVFMMHFQAAKPKPSTLSRMSQALPQHRTPNVPPSALPWKMASAWEQTQGGQEQPWSIKTCPQ